MEGTKKIHGFSKLSKLGKLKWLVENFFKDPESVTKELKSYWLKEDQQKVFDAFSENTISNYVLPYGVAPNMVINGKTYCVPMVTEESSVVAAAAAAAKFWSERGGLTATVINTRKIGQVHFKWFGPSAKLMSVFPRLEKQLRAEVSAITANMEARGGGIVDIQLKDFTAEEANYFQLFATFETCDSMGANFINSVLEQFGQTLRSFLKKEEDFNELEQDADIIMCILSNFTPDCIVKVEATCNIQDLEDSSLGMDASTFAERFYLAVRMAEIDTFRATTHNKGIFNGIDAVVIATGNDFRAVESCGHTFAARSGKYRSLSSCSIVDDVFTFSLEIPLAIGTIGGLTKLHPIARRSLELLGHPTAEELMQIIAATGLAQNFAAIRSLVTTGIQKGHMKMHLMNILNHLHATEGEIELALSFFADKSISFNSVREFLQSMRQKEENTLV